MKVLQLCNKPPYPPVDGGTMAMNSITQGLLEAGCEVRVLSVCSDKHPVRHDRMTEEYLARTRFEAVHLDLGIHPLGAAVAMLCGESYHVKRFVSNDFARRLREILEEEDFDIIHIESIFLTPYVPLIRNHSRARIILRAHNVEHLIWRRIAQGTRNPLKRWYLKHCSLTLRAYETEHANDFDGVMCITANDARLYGEMGCRRPVTAIPFGVEPEPMGYVDTEPDSLFHIGSMDWMPNREGIDWLLREVWPAVHRRLPQVRLYLAGRNMPDSLLHSDIEGVHVVGEVPDAMYFIGSKQINVVPLLSGSGIRVKIIEAMSAGKAVVTTTVGAEGIDYEDGRHLLIANTPDEFADRIARLVEDPDYCAEVGRNAYRLIAEEYSTPVLTKKILAFYNKILSR